MVISVCNNVIPDAAKVSTRLRVTRVNNTSVSILNHNRGTDLKRIYYYQRKLGMYYFLGVFDIHI